jgi:peptidoglycan hydrolase-like protein with peptidoglycan-binding domain
LIELKVELMKRVFKPANLVLLSLLVAGLGLPVRFLQAGTTTTQTTKKKTSSTSTGSSKTTSSRRAKTPKRASSRREKGQKAPTAERLSEIQKALAKDGSFTGSPNGKWDDSTVAAMKKFQAGHGLNPSGKLDAKTLQQLGLGSQTAGVAPPTPPVRISTTSSPAPESVSKQ